MPNSGEFAHRFGGCSWGAVDPQPIDGGPALLLVLDLSDPRLIDLGVTGTTELPLASYINNSVWTGEQTYDVSPEERRIALTSRSVSSPEPLELEDRLPQPLPERLLDLRPISKEEDPASVGKLAASDTFVGGEAFIRVLGSPVWLLDPIDVWCSCKARMRYVASIGYELTPCMLPKRPFFLGEGALYFFVCRACLRIAVRAQPT
jgi:hypothetical protein